MTISFRTRLMVVAALIVAGVLGAVLLLTWSNVRRVEVERLEARLCLEARRLASQPFREEERERLEADVMAKLRLGSPSQLLLRGEPAQPGAAFESRLWAAVPPPDRLAWTPVPDRPECAIATIAIGEAQWRIARFDEPRGHGFVGARADAATGELQSAVRGSLAIVVPAALALVAFGAWLLATLTMRPVGRLREAMRGMTTRALTQRLPTRGEDREFRELIGAYNTMLERLEASFEQASRFSADAAHELKTPLTILQGRLEQAMSRADDPAIQAELADMLEEVGRLAAITRKLLLLSQADAGRLALHVTRVDLSDLLSGLVADAHMLAGDRKVAAAVEGNLTIEGDALLLRQLFNNLISNAVRYGTPGGSIEVHARRQPSAVEVTVVNSASPIPPGDRSRLFDRFYRLDPARGREAGGSGLGLSIAREIARAHGGDVTLDPGTPDEFRMRVTLPTR